jgi:hypothetical protein
MLGTKVLCFEHFCGRRRKWLLSAVVIKINREHMCIILIKNGRINISSSILATNMCLICSAIVAVRQKCNVEQHFMATHKYYISKYPDNSKICKNKVEHLKFTVVSSNIF